MVMKLFSSLLIVFMLTIATAAAQRPYVEVAPLAPVAPPSPQTPPVSLDMRNAYQTRETLQQLLRQYPPSLSDVLRLDPSLLTNPGYLATYPNLAAFLVQHPEVAHNPAFFVGMNMGSNYGYRSNTPEDRSYELLERILAGLAMFTAAGLVLGFAYWSIRTVIEHRRWLRVSKVQSEVHSKLLDRFTSNQDLLSYVETSAGKHFLESGPISIEPQARGIKAPLNRILFSVQVGVVLALGGLGLNIVSQRLSHPEIAEPLVVVGVLAIALGIGFVLSAFIAYLMSRKLGLLEQTPLGPTSDKAGVSPPNA